MSETTTIKGNYHTWSLGGNKRTYADVHMSYREAIEYVIPVRYNALSGKGEQRELFMSHAKKLRDEILNGTYTPTQISGNLRKNHRDNLKLNEETGTFELVVDSGDPLAQTDGSHRYAAIDMIVKDLRERLDKATKESEKAKLQSQLDELLNLQIGVRIYFDGDSQRDFINLQCGRTVDAAHMLSLRIQKNVMGDPSFKLAFSVAKLLGRSEESPFHNLIRFDSKQPAKGSMIKQLPLSTIMGKSPSDLGTSLVGLARVASQKDATFLAHCICSVYNAIQEKAPEVFEEGKILTPIRNGGTKGSATMLIGLGICMAYRLITMNREMPSQEDLDRLVTSVNKTLNQQVNGNFSGPVKRSLMGAFARDFLADLSEDKHSDLPVGLLKATSPSTFAAEALPKVAKPRGRRKKATEVETQTESTATETTIPELTQADYDHFDQEVSGDSMQEEYEDTERPIYTEAQG